MTTITHRSRIKEPVSARDLSSLQSERARAMKEAGDAAVAQPYAGVKSGGAIVPGLFSVRSTGISTEPIRAAARAYLDSLDDARRATTSFAIDSDMWRRWSNVHMFLMRHGVSMEDMTPTQVDRTLALMRETLSPGGYELSRKIMKLNEAVREITGRDIEFGEWPYWVSIFGEPSAGQPWGWQIDGHHLILNCFVLGDQIVLAPQFLGSEPTHAMTGKYAGVSAFDEEDARGLALARSLTPDQLSRATIGSEPPLEEFMVAAYKDNYDLDYAGIRLDSLSAGQRELATKLIETYVHRLRSGHDEVWMEDVRRHLDETYFAWMGGTGDNDVFYYRVHSPVILIEFDHLRGVALETDGPTREHIHTVVRMPNGNDYGKDLLRQHYETSPHHARNR